jgi:hypothetical protein
MDEGSGAMRAARCEIRASPWFMSPQVTGDKGWLDLGERDIRIMFLDIFPCTHPAVD